MSTKAELIPPIFVSHGAPDAAIDLASARELERWGKELPRPRAVLVISAHWQAERLSRGSTAARPPLLYDLDGYPAIGAAEGEPNALSRVAYAAPGAPELAADLAALLPVDRTERAWDHGVWSPLARMFPAADIPVLQLSLVLGAAPRRLFAIGRKIGVLAERGYLILGSGGITHNVAAMDPRKDAEPPAWARAFDAWVANLLADAEIEDLIAWRSCAPSPREAHPTSEHFDPLFVVAGAASLRDNAVGFPIRGFEHGSLSRRCIQFGR